MCLPSPESTMTEVQALEEAKRRWGENGYVRRRTADVEQCEVGIRKHPIFWVKGAGKTWEDAFAQTDKSSN